MKAVPTYVEYRRAVAAYRANDSQLFLKLRRNRKLSRIERVLLEVRALFWSRRWKDATRLLTELRIPSAPVLEGERCFLLASASFQQGEIETSAYWNLKAREHFTQGDDRAGIFLSTHNLMVDLSRIGNLVLARAFFEEAQKLASEPRERALLYRAQACEASRARRYREACEWLARLLIEDPGANAHDREITLNVAADIYFRAGKYDEALAAIASSLALGGRNRDRGRLLFEQALIQLHQGRNTLGLLPAPVRKCGEYALKWELILALQGGEIERAQTLWNKLSKMVSGMFGPEFTCLDPSETDSAFFAAVERLRKPVDPLPAPIPLKGKLAILRETLAQARSPIRKEDLIERIWGVRYDPSWDPRLYKLIERGKRESLPIVSHQRAYRLQR